MSDSAFVVKFNLVDEVAVVVVVVDMAVDETERVSSESQRPAFLYSVPVGYRLPYWTDVRRRILLTEGAFISCS